MKDGMKVGFVLLHYQNMEVTTESVNYLKKLNNIENSIIVIVDNASPNNSGEALSKAYKDVDYIKVIRSDKNGGFACGNNIGYKYAKNAGADIIVVMNSDVFIKDEDFIDRVLGCATDSCADIVAPDIVIKNGSHQNPYLRESISTREQKKIIVKKTIGRFIYGIPFFGSKLAGRKSVREYDPYNKSKVEGKVTGLIPHGACVIYMPAWVKAEEIAFVEGTFLFVEEEILYDYCLNKGYKTEYNPGLVVYHMDDASQDAVSKNMVDKKRNQMKHEINSRKLLIKLRKEYEVS